MESKLVGLYFNLSRFGITIRSNVLKKRSTSGIKIEGPLITNYECNISQLNISSDEISQNKYRIIENLVNYYKTFHLFLYNET